MWNERFNKEFKEESKKETNEKSPRVNKQILFPKCSFVLRKSYSGCLIRFFISSISIWLTPHNIYYNKLIYYFYIV